MIEKSGNFHTVYYYWLVVGDDLSKPNENVILGRIWSIMSLETNSERPFGGLLMHEGQHYTRKRSRHRTLRGHQMPPHDHIVRKRMGRTQCCQLYEIQVKIEKKWFENFC